MPDDNASDASDASDAAGGAEGAGGADGADGAGGKSLESFMVSFGFVDTAFVDAGVTG